MSKQFYIGQRVRIAVAPNFPSLVGAEAVITSALHGTYSKLTGDFFEGHDIEIIGDGGQDWCAEPWKLEPLIPDGHRSGDYSYTELMDRLKAGEVECV
jgi:hypothetical protein